LSKISEHPLTRPELVEGLMVRIARMSARQFCDDFGENAAAGVRCPKD
jgi:hypothetical protein